MASGLPQICHQQNEPLLPLAGCARGWQLGRVDGSEQPQLCPPGPCSGLLPSVSLRAAPGSPFVCLVLSGAIPQLPVLVGRAHFVRAGSRGQEQGQIAKPREALFAAKCHHRVSPGPVLTGEEGQCLVAQGAISSVPLSAGR